MNMKDMLHQYRDRAIPQMLAVSAEFAALTPSEQRELLFWMLVDTATNPTTRTQPNAGTQGTA